jgi:hypothetical protein
MLKSKLYECTDPDCGEIIDDLFDAAEPAPECPECGAEMYEYPWPDNPGRWRFNDN